MKKCMLFLMLFSVINVTASSYSDFSDSLLYDSSHEEECLRAAGVQLDSSLDDDGEYKEAFPEAPVEFPSGASLESFTMDEEAILQEVKQEYQRVIAKRRLQEAELIRIMALERERQREMREYQVAMEREHQNRSLWKKRVLEYVRALYEHTKIPRFNFPNDAFKKEFFEKVYEKLNALKTRDKRTKDLASKRRSKTVLPPIERVIHKKLPSLSIKPRNKLPDIADTKEADG